MKKKTGKLMFASDYQEGAHPNILRRMVEVNMTSRPGYGTDEITRSARDRIRIACRCPGAEVEFLTGGTQTNAVVIGALLRPYQGVIAADTGHVAGHEAGAIEAGGHKVLTIPSAEGKITALQIDALLRDYDENDTRDHMVMPGMVYLSQPTEYGTLYTLRELEEISAVCRARNIPLYVDGARLAYALASPSNDVTLPDLAELTDAFYIGGTKCGALLGEAVVLPDASRIPHFFTIIKQNGALLAKGFLLGVQFDELFRDGLYEKIGVDAVRQADRIRDTLRSCGFPLFPEAPTNQIFFSLDDHTLEHLGEKVLYSFWEKQEGGRTVIRLCTSWATAEEDVDALCVELRNLRAAL